MGLVFDASSLIILDSVGLLGKICATDLQLIVPKVVSVREVNSEYFSKKVLDGRFQVLEPPTDLFPFDLRPGLGDGEIAVIALVLKEPQHWAVLDDFRGRNVARLLNVRFLGTARLVKYLIDKGMLGNVSVPGILYEMKNAGFHIDEETILRVMKEPILDLG